MSDIEKGNPSPQLDDNDIKSTPIITTTSQTNGEIIEFGKKIHLDTNKVDDAMELALRASKFQIDPKSDRKLSWKIDLMLVPFLSFLYAIQYMDKVTNSFGAIMGLKSFYKMEGNMYSWCGSSFYLGYLFFVFFASYLVQRFPPAKTCGVFIIIWGVINTVNCTPKTYSGFIALRTLLGCFESIVTPTMVILTSQWWKKEEQFIRTCIWFSATSFGTIFGYSIAYGVWIRQDSYSLPAWKVVFVVIGVMTIALGIMFVIYVPDSPAKAWFLSEDEKLHLVERNRNNNQGFGTKIFKMYQLKECLSDYRVWLIFIFGIVDEVPNGGITNFSSILISDLGYDTKQSLLLNLPLGAVGFAGCNIMALFYGLGLVKHRIPISIAAMFIAIAGSSMLAFASSTTVQLVGLYIMQVSPLGMIGCLTIYSSNIAGHTKKIVGNALYLVGYCAGNLIGPQTFKGSEAPTYQSGKTAVLVCYVLSTVILIILYVSYWFDNKKRDEFVIKNGTDHFLDNQEFADLTDRENPQFRYTL